MSAMPDEPDDSTDEDRFRAQRGDREDTGGWALLATWRCGDDVTEPDGGVIHWVIRRQDLAVLRFDRVHRYIDMA